MRKTELAIAHRPDIPNAVKIPGRMFRIGHLGDCNGLTQMATRAGCELGLKLSGVPFTGSGVAAALDYLASYAAASNLRAAG